MHFATITTVLLLAGSAVATPKYALEARANPKANEYPEPHCKDKNGGNKETYHHQTLCGCVTMDAATDSVYLATSPGQKMQAFTSGNCSPGKDKEKHLGEIGGECHELDTQFTQGRIGSILFYVPIICGIWDKLKDLADGMEEDEAKMLGEILAAA